MDELADLLRGFYVIFGHRRPEVDEKHSPQCPAGDAQPW